MSRSELVSVLFPCYEAASFLRTALDSVLSQSWQRLEVVAVDDGSTDATLEILRSYASRDDRVRVVVNEENRGLIATLNRALELATGSFIARMDADDVSEPGRIERQVAFLGAHPEVDAVGSAVLEVDSAGRLLRTRPARTTEPEAVDFLGLLATPVAHGTLLARTAVFREHGYRSVPETVHAEDYDMLSRMLLGGVRIANLPEPLYRLRTSPGSVSRRFEEIQISNFVTLAAAHLEERLGMRFDPPVQRVVVNRLDDTVGGGELIRGLRALDALRERFLADGTVSAEAEAEIDAVARQQQWDVLIQALLKGTPAQRATAALLMPAHAPSLRFGSVRSYLSAKLGRGTAPTEAGRGP